MGAALWDWRECPGRASRGRSSGWQGTLHLPWGKSVPRAAQELPTASTSLRSSTWRPGLAEGDGEDQDTARRPPDPLRRRLGGAPSHPPPAWGRCAACKDQEQDRTTPVLAGGEAPELAQGRGRAWPVCLGSRGGGQEAACPGAPGGEAPAVLVFRLVKGRQGDPSSGDSDGRLVPDKKALLGREPQPWTAWGSRGSGAGWISGQCSQTSHRG